MCFGEQRELARDRLAEGGGTAVLIEKGPDRVVGDVETGPHERKAQLRDPAGNQLLLYEPA